MLTQWQVIFAYTAVYHNTVVGGPFKLKSFDSLALLNKRWYKPAFAIYDTLLLN